VPHRHASESASWAEHAVTTLRGAGHRWGSARLAVVDVLAAQDCCLSAREIVDALAARGLRVGVASVYRALELLHGLGLVQRLDVGDGTARYEPAQPTGDHHHHIVCDRCGRVTAFEDEILERAMAGLAERLAHSIETHDVVLRGDCERCAGPAGG
jgi:Fur family ferric uptake transcriptional regulator